MAGVRDFLNSKMGKSAGIALAIVGALVVVWAARSNFGPSDVADASQNRLFMDAQTGKPFKLEIKAGMTIPVKAPSGGETGYPAELCFWTADGKIKTDPTPVLLNGYAGKPGPTFCPDCGRLVIGHNPRAAAGMNPPPTQAEYKPRRKP